jgi:hypothetical protein
MSDAIQQERGSGLLQQQNTTPFYMGNKRKIRLTDGITICHLLAKINNNLLKIKVICY